MRRCREPKNLLLLLHPRGEATRAGLKSRASTLPVPRPTFALAGADPGSAR